MHYAYQSVLRQSIIPNILTSVPYKKKSIECSVSAGLDEFSPGLPKSFPVSTKSEHKYLLSWLCKIEIIPNTIAELTRQMWIKFLSVDIQMQMFALVRETWTFKLHCLALC